MKLKLTKRSIKSLLPSIKPYEVIDEDIRSFLLRIQPSGIMTYYLSYRITAGLKKRFRIGHQGSLSAEQAREIALKLTGKYLSGTDKPTSLLTTEVPPPSCLKWSIIIRVEVNLSTTLRMRVSMDEVFKNDKMFTAWNSQQNVWVFCHIGDKVAYFGDPGAVSAPVRPNFLTSPSQVKSEEDKAKEWSAKFTTFFKTRSEVGKTKHAFYSLGRSLLPPQPNMQFILAINIAAMAFLLAVTPTSVNATSTNVTNSSTTNTALTESRMWYSSINLAMTIATLVYLIYLGGHNKYYEKPENIKWYKNEIEEEIKNKEAIISWLLSFLKYNNGVEINDDNISYFIAELEKNGGPNRYKKILESLKFLSNPVNTKVLEIAKAFSAANRSIAQIEFEFGMQQEENKPLPQEGTRFLATNGILYDLEMLENSPEALMYVYNICSPHFHEESRKIYDNIRLAMKSNPRVLLLIKETNQLIEELLQNNNIPAEVIETAFQIMKGTAKDILYKAIDVKNMVAGRLPPRSFGRN